MYVSVNVSLYFSHALHLQSMRTSEAHSTEHSSQNYQCLSQDCSTVLSRVEDILQEVFTQLWTRFLPLALCSGKQYRHYWLTKVCK